MFPLGYSNPLWILGHQTPRNITFSAILLLKPLDLFFVDFSFSLLSYIKNHIKTFHIKLTVVYKMRFGRKGSKAVLTISASISVHGGYGSGRPKYSHSRGHSDKLQIVDLPGRSALPLAADLR